jgi:large subunit ribosomal protein L10
MAIRAKHFQAAKINAIAAEKDRITSVKDYIFTDYRGMTVEQISTLRKQLREKNAVYHVVKNNFARIAFEECKFPDVAKLLVGPTAVAYAKADSNEIAKVLLDFAKENPVKIKGGLVDGNLFDPAQLVAFSKLPSKNQLIAMLMSAMSGPARNLAYALNAIPSKLVRTLKAVADKKAGEGQA